MKAKQITLSVLSGCFFLASCGGAETESTDENQNTDTTSVETEVEAEHEEIEDALAFDGVDKGEYTLYGHSEIDATGDELTTAEMFETMNTEGDFNGKVSVTINEVCQKAGCWITFENGENEPVRVFFRDHFTIPTETMSGTEAILYGQLVLDTMTVDFQKHLLDDAKEAGEEVDQAEYDAITEDKIETTFDCEAILVKK